MADQKHGRGTRSPSSKTYKTRAERNKRLKLERHARENKTTVAKLAAANGTNPNPYFPRVSAKFSPRRVELTGVVKGGIPHDPLHLLFVEGVLVEISPWAVDVEKAIRETGTFHGYTHEKLFPISGRRELIASRATN